MSLLDLGQQILRKFPQYQDMDLEELGRKALLKFPQYQDIASEVKQFAREAGQQIIHPEAQAGQRPSLADITGKVEQKFQTGVVEPAKQFATGFIAEPSKALEMVGPSAAGVGAFLGLDVGAGKVGELAGKGKQVISEVEKIGPQAKKVVEPVFKGLKNLSTKLLEQFRGLPEKIKLGRFEEIVNKAKKTGIKDVDEKTIRDSLVVEQGEVNLPKTAARVEERLVPLTPTPVKSPRWSSVGEDFIGDGKYGEIVYQSPIKTSAGDVHFRTQGTPGGLGRYDMGNQQPFPNYFSHVRYEDKGTTRKLMEVQSDLMQKENFPRSLKEVTTGKAGDVEEGVKKLSAYNSNDPLAHLRTFREEVKRAAKDGKDTLLVPTGETAMKIEGLGESEIWFDSNLSKGKSPQNAIILTSDKLRVGQEIARRWEEGYAPNRSEWIITDILGDGKFKAVPKDRGDFRMVGDELKQQGFTPDGDEFDDVVDETLKETFDISGKVDTKHFVYKLNEEAIPKEARKQGLIVEGKVSQDNGEWWQIRIPKEKARMPVEAFGALPLIQQERTLEQQRKERQLP